MPTKDELIRLQNIYRSDKKIGEALGDIPEYLVAYWRRKKGIPKPSFAKYSETQIRELWERHGDDFHCGRELGVSKAAFYSWRRKYKIKEKPQALKLEQLELHFGSETKMGTNGVYVEYYQTAYQKILSQASSKQTVHSGELIRVVPNLIILPEEYYYPSINNKILNKCWWIRKTGLPINIPESAPSNHILNGPYDIFYQGKIMPNQLIVSCCSEVHALGAFSAAIVMIEPENVTAVLENSVDMKVPEIIKVRLSGKLTRDLSVIDLLGFYVQQLKTESFSGKMIEFTGLGAEKLSGEEKMSLCYLLSLAGAKSSFCLFDETTRRALSQFIKVKDKIFFSDKTAHYESEYLLNTVGLSSYVFRDASLDTPVEVEKCDSPNPNFIFIGGPCGGSSIELKKLADIIKGKKINKSIACYISPLSQREFVIALKKKSVQILSEFGCQFLPVGMTLSDFLKIGPGEGVMLSVPDQCNADDFRGEIIFSSPQTAIKTAQAGKIA